MDRAIGMTKRATFFTFDRIVVMTVFALAILISAGVFVAFFQLIPIESASIAIDWKRLWPQLEGGIVQYGGGLLNPPWAALLMTPLGLLPLQASWGLLAFLTTLVLVVSVPRVSNKRLYWLSIALLVFSYPSLRHMVDGNFEMLIIGGALLTVLGFQRKHPLILAFGVLLLSSKPQAAALALLVLGVYALLEWKQYDRVWLSTAGIILAVTLPLLLWIGDEWLETMLNIPERTSIMNMSLMPALERIGSLPPALILVAWAALVGATLWVAWRTRTQLTREKLAFLLAASLLASPYSGGNSQIALLAVGIIPLFQKRPLVGGILIIMTAFPLLWTDTLRFNYGAWYATLTVFVMWSVLGYNVLNTPLPGSSHPRKPE
jgi:hypothetical protein